MQKRTIVPLENLFNLDSDSISLLHSELKRTGWCLIDMSSNFSKAVENFSWLAHSFFEQGQGVKQSYRYSSNFGYVQNEFKEAFRWLSGDMISTGEVPMEFCDEIKKISNDFDFFFKKLITEISKTFFCGFSSQEIGEIFKIPLLNESKEGPEGFGMFDLVKYYPVKLDREFLVSSHLDPGLLTFSAFSSSEGLEFLDIPNNEWVKVPLDLGIIWCGTTAIEISNQELKGGWHRVQKATENGRVAFWYEVCIEDQLSEDNLTIGMTRVPLNYKSEVSTSDSSDISDSEPYIPISVKTFSNKIIPMKVKPKTTIMKIKKKIERSTGIPLSKSLMGMKSLIAMLPKNKQTVKEIGIKSNDVLTMNYGDDEAIRTKKINAFMKKKNSNFK